MTETNPTAKAGLTKLQALPKRAPSNNTKPEVDNLTKEPPLVELLDKELEPLLPNPRQDPKLETEVPPPTQDILLVTTFSELVLLPNKSNRPPKTQMLPP